jgi:hypothetical protein
MTAPYKRMVPPDLHDWIKRYGGYSNITQEGWAAYDAAMSAYWEEVLAASSVAPPKAKAVRR